MMNLLKLGISLAFLSVVCMAQAYAANAPWWINVGAGAGAIFGYEENAPQGADEQGNEGIAGAISFNHMIGRDRLVTVRASGSNTDISNLSILGVEDEYEDQVNYIADLGVLYGVVNKTQNTMASIAAGLSYVNVGYESQQVVDDVRLTDTRTVSTIGLPIEAQLFWTPFQSFGVGLIGMANINPEVSYVAGLLAVQFGAL